MYIMDCSDEKAFLKDMEEIAEKFGGEYRAVTLDKEKKKKYAEPKRKKNTTRGKVWGLNLKEK